MARWARRLRVDRRGGAAVEFAVLAPVFLTLLIGAVEFGRMFYIRQNLEYATESAARYYSMNSSYSTSQITNYLQGLMANGLGSSVAVSYSSTTNCNSNSSVTCTTITATYPFTFVEGYLGLGSKTVTATSEAVLY